MTEAISVSKLNTYIKQIFDAEELLHNIPVVGEVFGVSLSRNVIYFSLKDENATLSCVCFYPNYISLIEEGSKVIVTGSPNYYVKGGKLNFNVIKVEKVGQGKLYEEFLKLKEKLQNEGLFDIAHKKPLPKVINRIGVITSKEGAVIQDIKNIAWRRNPSVDIVLYNTKVQGNLAENEIAHAIDVMGKYDKIDVIIVARGGGSLEDLWAYNTEIVARSAYNCPKPLISAVGHETDFTIIDFVSDLRAPTPSAAAELLTYDLADRKAEMWGVFDYFNKTATNYIQDKFTESKILSLKLTNNIEKLLSQEETDLLHKKENLIKSLDNFINQKYYEIGLVETTIQKIDPTNILKSGFAKVEQDNGSVNLLQDLNMDKDITLTFYDGIVKAQPIKENKK